MAQAAAASIPLSDTLARYLHPQRICRYSKEEQRGDFI
jgi:hypothetical protein